MRVVDRKVTVNIAKNVYHLTQANESFPGSCERLTVLRVEDVVVQPPCLVDAPQRVCCHLEREISSKHIATNLR